MKPEDKARIARNLWGFFTICVWLVGTPKVIELAITGSKTSLNAFTCATAQYNCPGGKDAPKEEKTEREILGEFSDAEWKEMQAIANARRRTK